MVVMRVGNDPHIDLVAQRRQKTAQVIGLGALAAVDGNDTPVGCAYDVRIAVIVGHRRQLPQRESLLFGVRILHRTEYHGRAHGQYKQRTRRKQYDTTHSHPHTVI